MKIILTIVWGILCAACFIYAFVVKAVNSGNMFFLFWIFAGVVFAFFAFAVQFSLWSKLPHILKVLFIIVVAVGLGIFVVVEGMILSRFNAKAEQGADYVCVLGAQVKENGPSTVLKFRLDKTIEYLNDNPETKCIVTGNKGDNEPFTEAAGMADYLIKQGISPDRIIMEEKAVNTAENIKYSMQIADLSGKKVAIVTNNFHMFRALKIAKKQGLEAEGIAADSMALYLVNNMVREFIGTIKDWMVGNL